MSVKEEIADVLKMKPADITKSYLFLTGTLLLYAGAGVIPIAPSPFALPLVVLFLIFWIGAPIAIYYDRRHVKNTSEWTPSKLYYFGFLPGYLGIAIIGYYLYKRTGWYRSTLTGQAQM